MNRRFVVILPIAGLAIVALALVALAYLPPHRADGGPAVGLICDNGSEVRLSVEIADTPAEWTRGLMGRSSLAADTGMLFVFDDEAERYFWMEDTLIPLDMIFVAGNLTIIDVHRDATPLSRDIIPSGGPCRYVLEVNGGLCNATGVGAGDHVRLYLDK